MGMYVVFDLGNEHYAVDIARVQSIEYTKSITRVPSTPDYVHGVMNLRGMILGVIDLRTKFGMATAEWTKETRIVVVSHNAIELGWIVDSAQNVIELSADAISPPDDTAQDYVSGLARFEDQAISILDVAVLLTTDLPLHA